MHASMVAVLALAGASAFLVAAERALDQEMSARTRSVVRMARTSFDATWLPALEAGSLPVRELVEGRLRDAAAASGAHRLVVLDGRGAVLASSDPRIVPGERHPGLAVDGVEAERAREEGEAVTEPYRLEHGGWYQSAYLRVQDGDPRLLGVDLAVSWRAPLQRLRTAVAFFGVTGVACVAALGFLLSRGITRPLARLVAAIESAGPDGLPSPAGVAGDDEIGRLGRRFDELVEAIHRHDVEMRALSATVAHEVRNPLGAMSGFAELLARRHQDPDSKRFIDGIREEIDALERLVVRFLRYAGGTRGEYGPVALLPVLEDALRAAIPPEAAVRVERTFPAKDPVVSGDADALREVFVNLLRNAGQATEFRGTIGVGVDTSGADLLVHIRDDGPGIPEKIQEHLFEPFATSRADGTGLGLAICRRIVGNHRGTIAHEPTPAGTTFVVRLPALTAAVQMPADGAST